MNARSLAVVTMAISCLGTVCTVWAFSEVHVDFQPAGGTTASGYVAVTNANRWDNSTSADLGGGVHGAWLDYLGAHTGDRGAGYPDVLTRDFMQWNGSDTPETFKMTGIVPGNYNLKIYAWDPQYNDKNTSFEIDGNNDGTYDVTMQISNPAGEHDKTCQVAVSSAQVLTIRVSRIGSASGAICGLDLIGTGPDPNQPAAITTLSVVGQTLTQVTLRWTAPADDGGSGGTVSVYDVRCSTDPISDANWNNASQAYGEPTPATPGTQENYTVRGLACDTTYYFAVKSADGGGSVSPLSNVVSTTTQAPTVPPALELTQRIANRTYPSIFQAWNRADNLAPERPLGHNRPA